jgi:hypothetical protein
MSWVFGIIGSKQSTPCSRDYERSHGRTLLKLSLPKFYLALGGIDETCFFEVQNEFGEVGWAIVGLGIHVTDAGARLLCKNDWKNFLASGFLKSGALDGHFVALRWDREGVEFYTDQLGLRTAYYGKCDEGICFSTRQDWVARTTGLHEINKASLGERWLLFNQLTYESCVNGIERLGPSSHVIIKNDIVIKHESRLWLPEFGNDNSDHAKSILDFFVQAAINSGRTVSLGLSGGFDSRTLLALLMASRSTIFGVHTFGEMRDPDVRISESIANEFRFPWVHYNDPIPNAQELLPLVQSFVAQNILVEPASSILRLRYYSLQHARGQLIIDGGFGEIARRQYLNRIVRLGRSALLEGNIARLFQLIRVTRADIFTPEYTKEIECDAFRSLEATLHAMPPVAEIGIENFVDLLSVRTRVPNFGGPEQARSDAYVINFMPMVQPSFLKAAFKTDIQSRRNGRFYKKIIQENEARLMRFPLVKSGTTYPFGIPLPAAWFITKVKSKMAKPFFDPTPDRFLMQLKEYVLDLVHSSEVRNWQGYNTHKLHHAVDAYYNGEKCFRNIVDWWLTFELWRRSFL